MKLNRLAWVTQGFIVCWLLAIGLAQAQIVPDGTLGNERSQVTPITSTTERIEGGAVRGANLFHSFSEFNVGDGRGVYFANPSGIANIFSRVTGRNVSSIDGILGVLGNANLFLLNPNGILFGPNARLDIRGSFLASTSSSFQFPDGSEFSATNPQTAPLLTVNLTPGLQYGTRQSQTTIANRGKLATGQDLTLAADNLDVQGSLQAGRDLTLAAQNTVQMRDTGAAPSIVTSGRDLVIQGNQGVDILTLTHPQTQIHSGRNLSLISDGIVSGDAHFSSGGDFQIRSVSGQLANFTSLYDPIISSTGNVDIAANYGGAGSTPSLLIESQGNVRIRGTVTINAPDTVSNFVGEDAVLATKPGLIIRSGQTNLVYGGTDQSNPPVSTNGTVPPGITLEGAVRVQPDANGSVVKLSADNGGITFHSIDASNRSGGNGGAIELTARGDIINTGSFADPFFSPPITLGTFSYANPGDSGTGGNISLTSTGGSILLRNGGTRSYSYSRRGDAGDGGAISFFVTDGNLSLSNAFSASASDSDMGVAGTGGAISFSVTNGNLSLTNSNSNSWSDSNSGIGGNGGAISFSVTNGNLSLANSSLTPTSRSDSGIAGNGGAVSFSVTNGNLSLTNSNLFLTSSSPSSSRSGIGGALSFSVINGNLSLSNADFYSSSEATEGVAGNGGAMSFSVTNGNLSLSNLVSKSYSYSRSGTAGNGGAISFSVSNGNLSLSSADFDSYSSSNPPPFLLSRGIVGRGTAGNGGAISFSVKDGNLSLVNSDLNSSSNSHLGPAGNGGAISFSVANGNLSLSNLDLDSSSFSVSGATGNGGGISFFVTNGDLSLLNADSNSYSTSTSGATGNGGAISFFVTDGNLFLSNSTSNTSSSSRAGAAGNGGVISLLAREGSISGSSAFLNTYAVTESRISGNGGTVILEARNAVSGLNINTIASGGSSGDVQVKGTGDLLLLNNRIQTAQQVEVKACPTCTPFTVNLSDRGQAGNVSITSTGNLTFNDNLIQSDTRSNNPAGNITIYSPGLITFNNSQIISNTSSTGQAGSIGIEAGQSITLANGSQLSARTRNVGTAGNITLNASILNVSGDAQVLAETQGSGQGGSILVNAPTAVNLTRVQDFSPILSVEASGAGKAGNIVVNTPRLTLADLARITATSTAEATNLEEGGSITLNASKLYLAGIVGVFAETQGRSPAGTLRLNPYQDQPDLGITLTPSSKISASTSGSGKGGDLILTAPRSIAITGSGKLAVETNSTGDAGNININTQQLTLTDGVQLSASTSGRGRAGDINITAKTVDLNRGAQISTNTAGNGQAGNLLLQLQDALTLTGTGTGLFATTAPGSTGNGGNITIDPRLVLIQDGATIAVSSKGSGTGGNINVRAGRLELRDRASITAETTSTQGGNIALNVKDWLLLRRNSLISATAGVAQAEGDGGNIMITAPFIIAVQKENSDIMANAFSGKGGNITLNTNAIYGLTVQPQLTPFSDITASSQLGISGTITINTLNVDPNRGLVALPTSLEDASRKIAQGCRSTGREGVGRFVATGRGGLPPDPTAPLTGATILTAEGQLIDDLKDTKLVGHHLTGATILTAEGQTVDPAIAQSPPSSEIVEATGWYTATDGSVILSADVPALSNYQPFIHPVFCDGR